MRSKYIYLVVRGGPTCAPGLDVLSAHTVKHEAHTWLERNGLKPTEASLYRMRDGGGAQLRDGWYIDWDPALFKADHLTKASSQVADWPDWKKGMLG
jgi:hypothetical protein